MLSTEDQEFKLAHLFGFPIEFLLFGIYILSFCFSLVIAHRQRRQHTLSIKIFYLANITLFLIATAHAILGLSRIFQAFVTDAAGPSDFFMYPTWNKHWENLAFYILIYLSMNIGDALVIYRCYIIWSRNIYVVSLPILAALFSSAAGVVMNVSFGHPDIIPQKIFQQLLTAVYSVHFAQNIITTSLIVWRLWRHHYVSTKAGVRTLGASLAQTARIIVESAMVYTILLLGLIILDVRKSNYLYTLQYALAPGIGIVFNLISIRVFMAQAAAASRMPNTSLLPRFDTASARISESSKGAG